MENVIIKCTNYNMFLAVASMLKWLGYNIKRDKNFLVIYLTN